MLSWVKRLLAAKLQVENSTVVSSIAEPLNESQRPPEDDKKLGDIQLEAGNLPAAEQCYRQAITNDSRFVKAYHNLGYVLKEQGRYDEAANWLTQALAIDPANPTSHYLLGGIAQLCGDTQQALSLFRKTLASDPGFEFAYRDLCILLVHEGLVAEAREVMVVALTHFPAHAEFHCLLANIYYTEGEPDLAIASYEQTIALRADYVEAYLNLSVVLQDQDKCDQALAILDRAIEIDPGLVDIYIKQAAILQKQGKYDLALAAYSSAITIRPEWPLAHANLGSLYEEFDHLEQALDSYTKAAALAPLDSDMQFNIGSVLQKQYRFDEAVEQYHRVLKINDKHHKSLVNLASVLDEQGKYGESLACYDHTLALYPDLQDAHSNKAYLLLRLGRFAEGWQEHEYRGERARPEVARCLWLGDADLSGKTILLYGEQGLGDMLQFVRYANMVVALGAKVYVCVPFALKSLVANSMDVTVLTPDEEMPAYDYICPLMSLPLAFKTDLETIPNEVPYLICEPEKIAYWREKLGKKNALRVGLVWGGNPEAPMNKVRSIPFAQLQPLLEIDDIEFYSLQIGGEARSQIQACAQVRDLTSELLDFQDTTAFIHNLDLVISVDTSVVHLTGALGKAVWMLDRYKHCYRWLPGREDSPWYPSMRIFRQSVRNDWGSVIETVKRALQERARSFSSEHFECSI